MPFGDVIGKLLDHDFAPRGRLGLAADVFADLPVKADQFLLDNRERRARAVSISRRTSSKSLATGRRGTRALVGGLRFPFRAILLMPAPPLGKQFRDMLY